MSSSPAVHRSRPADDLPADQPRRPQGPRPRQLSLHRQRQAGAIVVDDQTQYGKGLADSFAKGFEGAGGTIVVRRWVKVGDTDFRAMLTACPRISTSILRRHSGGRADPQQMRELA